MQSTVDTIRSEFHSGACWHLTCSMLFKKQIAEKTNRKVIFNVAALQRKKPSHDRMIIISGLYYDLCIGVQVVAIL